MSEIEPNFKDNKGDCECGCGQFATYRVKPMSDGKRHTRNCDIKTCRFCRGKANHSRGHRKQDQAAKRMKIKPSRDEESGRGAHRYTHKDDKLHAKRIYSVWDSLEAEDNYKRPIGDTRVLVQSFSQPGRHGGLLLIPDEDEAIYALALQRGFFGNGAA